MTITPYISQVIAPTSEPLTLTEAKLYLRVDHSDDDAVITRMIAASRRKAESYVRRSLITQSWRLMFDDYAPTIFALPRGPVQSITHVKLIAKDGAETTLDASAYHTTAGNKKLVFDISPMAHLVEVQYVAGYGEAADVPVAIKQGMLGHIATMYDTRDITVAPDGITCSLYDDFREICL